MLDNTSQDMKAEMTKIYGIGLTTDSWTSCATEHYIAYTTHYITDEWELVSKLLSTDCSVDKHTAQNLAEDMIRTENKWGTRSTGNQSSLCSW